MPRPTPSFGFRMSGITVETGRAIFRSHISIAASGCVVDFGHMANLTQYSERKRAEALAIVAACGGKVAEAARRVGVPRRTLQRWKDEADNRDLQAAARQGVANAKAAKVAKRIAQADCLSGPWTEPNKEAGRNLEG